MKPLLPGTQLQRERDTFSAGTNMVKNLKNKGEWKKEIVFYRHVLCRFINKRSLGGEKHALYGYSV